LYESYLAKVASDEKPLGNHVRIVTGKLNANAAVESGQYPFFTCSRETFQIDDYAFDCEAILLAGNNASGDFNVKHYAGKFNAYQRTYVITVNDENELTYRYLYFQMLRGLKQLKKGSVGVGTKFLKLDMIKNLPISVPSIARQREVLSVLDALNADVSRIESIYQQKLHALSELKQCLLKKAFSGELTAVPQDEIETALA
jgi:type I restriction enzyme, S subunit